VEIRKRLCELASQYPRYGYLLLYRLLRKASFVVNKKRVYRIYQEARLQVPKRKHNKLIRTRQRQAVQDIQCDGRLQSRADRSIRWFFD